MDLKTVRNVLALCVAVVLGAFIAVGPRLSAQDEPAQRGGRGAGRGGGRGGPRQPPEEIWAPQPVPETPFTPPNKLIWRFNDILASHKGQANWVQHVVKTRDFEGDYIQMAPGEKTKTMFYADDRVFWWVASGQLRFNIKGQEPFVATKGFLVQVAPNMEYSMSSA